MNRWLIALTVAALLATSPWILGGADQEGAGV